MVVVVVVLFVFVRIVAVVVVIVVVVFIVYAIGVVIDAVVVIVIVFIVVLYGRSCLSCIAPAVHPITVSVSPWPRYSSPSVRPAPDSDTFYIFHYQSVPES